MLLEAAVAAWLRAPPSVSGGVCPADMALVEGVHAEYVQRVCLDFRRERCFSFLPGIRAEEGVRTPVRTCMDRHEWPNRKGELPVVMLRFVEAEAKCTEIGKRLCTEYEWETACEGPDRLPWPYGQRFEPQVCNQDKPYRNVNERALASKDARVRAAETKRLWQGEPTGSHPACVSPSGIFDMTGNVEEWVKTSRPEWPHRSSLKGGYWSKPGSGCRGTNERHDPQFRYYEIGFRCCKDPT
jgi:formylglycine-generating enzyme required for sulfatase activity